MGAWKGPHRNCNSGDNDDEGGSPRHLHDFRGCKKALGSPQSATSGATLTTGTEGVAPFVRCEIQ